jgi:hypothetical protein
MVCTPVISASRCVATAYRPDTLLFHDRELRHGSFNWYQYVAATATAVRVTIFAASCSSVRSLSFSNGFRNFQFVRLMHRSSGINFGGDKLIKSALRWRPRPYVAMKCAVSGKLSIHLKRGPSWHGNLALWVYDCRVRSGDIGAIVVRGHW